MAATRVILTGFMGTGKTAVGKKLAGKLHYRFLDTDLLLEKEKGKPVSKIFEEEGEPAFRKYEKAVLQKALTEEKVVIATGGGTIVDPENLKLMKEKGVLITLAADPEVILQRIGHSSKRPLLQADDKMARIQELLEQRQGFYQQAHHAIDTSQKSVEEIVEEIAKILKGGPHG